MRWNNIHELPPPPNTDLLVGADIHYSHKVYGHYVTKFRAIAYIKDSPDGYVWRNSNDNNKLWFYPEFWAPIAPLPKDGDE